MRLVLYDYVGPFIDGLARVRKGQKWFHILQNGSPAYPSRYSWVDSFCGGVAWASDDKGWFQIGCDGQPIDGKHYCFVNPHPGGIIEVVDEHGGDSYFIYADGSIPQPD